MIFKNMFLKTDKEKIYIYNDTISGDLEKWKKESALFNQHIHFLDIT